MLDSDTNTGLPADLHTYFSKNLCKNHKEFVNFGG